MTRSDPTPDRSLLVSGEPYVPLRLRWGRFCPVTGRIGWKRWLALAERVLGVLAVFLAVFALSASPIVEALAESGASGASLGVALWLSVGALSAVPMLLAWLRVGWRLALGLCAGCVGLLHPFDFWTLSGLDTLYNAPAKGLGVGLAMCLLVLGALPVFLSARALSQKRTVGLLPGFAGYSPFTGRPYPRPHTDGWAGLLFVMSDGRFADKLIPIDFGVRPDQAIGWRAIDENKLPPGDHSALPLTTADVSLVVADSGAAWSAYGEPGTVSVLSAGTLDWHIAAGKQPESDLVGWADVSQLPVTDIHPSHAPFFDKPTGKTVLYGVLVRFVREDRCWRPVLLASVTSRTAGVQGTPVVRWYVEESAREGLPHIRVQVPEPGGNGPRLVASGATLNRDAEWPIHRPAIIALAMSGRKPGDVLVYYAKHLAHPQGGAA